MSGDGYSSRWDDREVATRGGRAEPAGGPPGLLGWTALICAALLAIQPDLGWGSGAWALDDGWARILGFVALLGALAGFAAGRDPVPVARRARLVALVAFALATLRLLWLANDWLVVAPYVAMIVPWLGAGGLGATAAVVRHDLAAQRGGFPWRLVLEMVAIAGLGVLLLNLPYRLFWLFYAAMYQGH